MNQILHFSSGCLLVLFTIGCGRSITVETLATASAKGYAARMVRSSGGATTPFVIDIYLKADKTDDERKIVKWIGPQNNGSILLADSETFAFFVAPSGSQGGLTNLFLVHPESFDNTLSTSRDEMTAGNVTSIDSTDRQVVELIEISDLSHAFELRVRPPNQTWHQSAFLLGATRVGISVEDSNSVRLNVKWRKLDAERTYTINVQSFSLI